MSNEFPKLCILLVSENMARMYKNTQFYLTIPTKRFQRHSHANKTLICVAVLGTPAALRANNIQYPGSSTPGSLGRVMVYVRPLAEAVSATRLWSVLTVCVDEPCRIMANVAATSVVTVSVAPGFSCSGDADWMVGRVAALPSVLKRYGGEKICTS